MAHRADYGQLRAAIIFRQPPNSGDRLGGAARHSYRHICRRPPAAMAFNLTRAAGTLASVFHAKATTGTIRAQLITVPARLARSARCLTLHLPEHWPWAHAWQRLLGGSVHGPPLPA